MTMSLFSNVGRRLEVLQVNLQRLPRQGLVVDRDRELLRGGRISLIVAIAWEKTSDCPERARLPFADADWIAAKAQGR